MPATKIVVNIPGEAPYDVRIGATVLGGLGESVRRLDGVGDAPHLLVLTDSNVGPLYLEEAKSSLKAAGFRVSDIVVPAGEDSKSLAVAGEIWSAMASLGLTRDCAVVALGGGVVGDLAGFVASTYMRGIPFVQVPTSLLAMVDSSVGGKTGVNLPEGKNLVGTFKQPAYVCASTAVLVTLDDREWACGCAEIAKASVIDSDEFFFWMMDHAAALEARDPVVVTEAIARSVVFKANIVAEDKTESRGVRECLNYGHTLGMRWRRSRAMGRSPMGPPWPRACASRRASAWMWWARRPSWWMPRTSFWTGSGCRLWRGRRRPTRCWPP